MNFVTHFQSLNTIMELILGQKAAKRKNINRRAASTQKLEILELVILWQSKSLEAYLTF